MNYLSNIFAFQLNPEKDYEFRDVVQKPISPAYSEILKLTQRSSLKHLGITIDKEEKK